MNDLVSKINSLHCGVKFDNYEISLFLYADDLTLIAESENDLQPMLNCLCEWCCKWRMKINLGKTNIIHFKKNV